MCLYNLLNDALSTGVEWEHEHERQIEKDVECRGRGRLKHYQLFSSGNAKKLA